MMSNIILITTTKRFKISSEIWLLLRCIHIYHSFIQWCGWPEILTPTVVKCWWKKRRNTMSMHVLKLDFIALNDCFWATWHSWGEKMLMSIKFCKNCFGSGNSYPNRVWSVWSFPTPLVLSSWHHQINLYFTYFLHCINLTSIIF